MLCEGQSMTRCVIAGQVYMIPNLWLAGRTTKLMHYDKLTASEAYLTAIRHWHEQALLSEEWAEQHGEIE
jgi:hypothetical protein